LCPTGLPRFQLSDFHFPIFHAPTIAAVPSSVTPKNHKAMRPVAPIFSCCKRQVCRTSSPRLFVMGGISGHLSRGKVPFLGRRRPPFPAQATLSSHALTRQEIQTHANNA